MTGIRPSRVILVGSRVVGSAAFGSHPVGVSISPAVSAASTTICITISTTAAKTAISDSTRG